MKKYVSRIWNSSSARNVGKLLSANVIAQVIGLLIYPVLTRIYTPEDFGLLNLFSSICTILILLSTLEWYNAIVLPQKEEEACSIVHLCVFSIGILTVIIAFTIPFANPIAHLFKSPQLANYYWMTPLYVMMMGLWNVLNYWYIRHEQYGRISGFQVSQSLFTAGYKTGFGFLNISGGLIYGTLLAPLCSLFISLRMTGKQFLAPLLRIDQALCRKVARTYANFPKFSTPRTLLNSMVGQLPVLLLTPLFGNANVGILGMAMLLAFVPINMLTKALYQVLYQRTTERVQQRLPIYRYYKRFIWLTACIVLIGQALIFFPLPWIIGLFLGEKWVMASQLIRWSFPWMLCYILTFSIGFIPDIFAKQKIELYFEILLAILRIAGLSVGIWRNDFVLSIAGYAVGSAIGTFARFVWQMVLIKRYEMALMPAPSSKDIS